MCTALKYKQTMGRNFDYEVSYGEEIVQIPRHKYDNIYSIFPNETPQNPDEDCFIDKCSNYLYYVYSFLLTFGDSCVIIIINNCNLKMEKQIPFL